MTKQEDGSVEIYIGSRIQHISEQRVLEHLVSLLAELKRCAIILANVNLGGHQLDLILALNDLTLLIEVKGYTRPVSGGANGAWQVLLASGKTKNAVNAYQQALNAMYALRDVMRAFHDADVDYYPQAAVVFVPKIHPQSSILPGDHKVSLISMSDLEELIRKQQKGCWKIPAWRAFALHHNLHPIADVRAACDPAMFEAERSVTAYLAEFSRTYAPTAETIVKFRCTSDGDSVGSDDVAHQIEKGCDALILGPSGCGKTLLAYSAGVAHARARGVPIIVSAKHFEGSFREILDREVGLMARCSAADLLAMARQLNLPTLLIVDGYNECEAQHRVALTRGISAISNHFQMGVLITSQSNPLRLDLLPGLRPYWVPATERTVKVAIASKAMRGATLSTAMESLIDLVGSGLEASLIGEVGLEVSSGVSRHALFDAYARKRLGALAMDGIRALSVIADCLVARVALSLSVRDLDRVSETQGVPARLVGDLTELDRHLSAARHRSVHLSGRCAAASGGASGLARR